MFNHKAELQALQTENQALKQELAQWRQLDTEMATHSVKPIDDQLLHRLVHHILGYLYTGGHYSSEHLWVTYWQLQNIFAICVGQLAGQNEVQRAYHVAPCYRNRYGIINHWIKDKYQIYSGSVIVPDAGRDVARAEFQAINPLLERLYYSYCQNNGDDGSLQLSRLVLQQLDNHGCTAYDTMIPLDKLVDIL